MEDGRSVRPTSNPASVMTPRAEGKMPSGQPAGGRRYKNQLPAAAAAAAARTASAETSETAASASESPASAVAASAATAE
jgi:hypothetical protein